MTAFFIILLILLGVGLFFWAIWCCFSHGSKQEHATPIVEKRRTVCHHCLTAFEWEEKDALVKYASNGSYKVPCPHCRKILHLYNR